MVGRGVSADLVAGSTGEPWSLSTAERALVCRAVRDRVPAGAPVLLGTGSFGSWDAAHYARLQETAGDSLLGGQPPAVVQAAAAEEVLAVQVREERLPAEPSPRATLPS